MLELEGGGFEMRQQNEIRRPSSRRESAIVMALVAALAMPAVVRATEIVPSIGVTRTVDNDESKSNLGLALRGNVAGPAVQTELAVTYRKDEYFGGGLETKTIPIMASLLLRPVPSLHADVGVGWYHTKYDYASAALEDETKQDFGVHVGGGLQVPIAPKAAIDLTGRYGFMKDQESKLVPETFDPDFWTMSLGLALKL
jgi:hypothetical protein